MKKALSTLAGAAERPAVLAHRGAWKSVPGPSPANSLAALLAAVALGADGVEVDLHLTADERIVLHHDATVGQEDRAAGCEAALGAPLCSLPRSALSHLAELGPALEALETAAAEARRPVLCNLEVKELPGSPGAHRAGALLDQLGEVLTSRRSDRGQGLEILVSCFALEYLERLAGIAPTVAIAYLTPRRADQYEAARRAAAAGCVALHPEHESADPALVGAAAQLGLQVIPWTVDSASRAVALVRAGAAGIITNDPRQILAAVKAATPPSRQ